MSGMTKEGSRMKNVGGNHIARKNSNKYINVIGLLFTHFRYPMMGAESRGRERTCGDEESKERGGEGGG